MASWDEPTGETPAVSERPARSTARRRSPVDQAVTTLLIAALVVTVAVGAFLFGRARTDSSVSGNTPATSTASIAAEVSTTATTARRAKVATTDTTTPAAADTVPVSTSAPATTATTSAPATTATTAPPTTTAVTTATG
jgi:cytoskeletal protein RodZ